MKMKTKVLAVLALALLMINMAPVRKAEAAEVPDGTVPVQWYGKEVYVPLGTYEYYLLFEGVSSSDGGSLVYLSDSPFVHKSISGAYPHQFNTTSSCTYYGSGSQSDILKTKSENGAPYSFAVKDLGTVIYSNYVIYNEDGSVWREANSYDPEPLVLPVTEPGYDYWLYHKTTSGEYMYWSKDPFDLEVSDGKYLLNLSTGDIVYRLHMNPSHVYYRQVLSGSMQYVVSSGDLFRSSHELVFDGVTIEAWTEGDVTSEVVEEQYSIPHIVRFWDRVRGVRSPLDGPREYFFAINLELSGEYDDAVTEKKVLVDGNYILPSVQYFRFCEVYDYEPSTTHFMSYVKQGVEEYYITVNWSHIESIVNRSNVVSDYMFRLTYSNAVDALIERGEFNDLYPESVQAVYGDDIRRLCCPYRLACTLIGVIDEEYYYGDTYITVLYSELDKTQDDVFGVYSDYVSLDNEQKNDAIESTINGAQSDKLQEYIDKKDAELDALIQEYEMKLATLDATISSDQTGDLFTTFSNITNGLVSMTASFRNIATAVGNVFAFFPEEFTSLLYAGFVVLLVVAAYKALK